MQNIEEKICNIVSSRGIMYSCDVFPKNPVSDTSQLDPTDYENIKENNLVYVISTCVPLFVENVLPKVTCKFVLVTGDSTKGVPNEISMGCEEYWKNKIVNNDHIIHWFTQNYDLNYNHEKITPIPIGLDYHTLKENETFSWGSQMSSKEQETELLNIRKTMSNFLNVEERNGKPCITNASVDNEHRKKFLMSLQKNNLASIVDYRRQPRKQYWKNHKSSLFALSPQGNGFDCHRTWEALVLNNIVILDTPTLMNIYNDLPVILIDDWNKLSIDYLNKQIETIKGKQFNMNKILLKYWVDLMKKKCN